MIESLYEAAGVLGLGENATLMEINSQYKALLFQWHPDHCKENPEECTAMTEKIIESYKLIINYCYNYKISFSKEDLEKKIPSLTLRSSGIKNSDMIPYGVIRNKLKASSYTAENKNCSPCFYFIPVMKEPGPQKFFTIKICS